MIEQRTFIVYGRPQAKQRPRMFRGRAYTPQATQDWEAKIRAAYLAVYPDADPFLGELSVTVTVVFRNKTHGDLDNYIKTLDGLNTIAWKDDKQIRELHGFLYVNKGDLERMEISIRPLTEVQQ